MTAPDEAASDDVEAAINEWADILAADAPPLTPGQVRRLRRLFDTRPASAPRGDA